VDDQAALVSRAPIVTIMGHVDHGKTSLLDFIRNANVVSGEAGGITQHIGAYEVTAPSGKKVTFLDTPGHEAFTAMRARGAKVTDIAVIVIAADDAVMPQTKEAISHAQAANVPMIFAINKIDKDGANPQKIYEQLSGMNILVEEWGGKFQSQEISAKQGLNIDLLLEKILLEAEIQELKANPDRMGTGTVIEATLDKGRGYVTTVLVLNGSLEIGDVVVSGPYFGRVKAMFNERNEKTELAGPSSPALILGLNGAPQAGEKFKVFEDEGDAKSAAYRRGQILREQGMRTRKHITLDEIGRRLALGNFKELNVIIKGDVDGSVEALSDSLQKLSTEEIVVNVILKGVGAISENDVTLASASDAIIMAFNVRPNLQASKLAEVEGIQIKQYSIIYNAIADIKSAMEGLLEPKIEEKEVATVEVREVFKFDKATVAGCYVLDGRLKRDAKIRLFRDGVLIYPRTEGAFAELGSLKRYKDDVKEVVNNYECGLTLKNYIDLQVGDTLVAIEEDEVKRTL
jgi:translation initiation factor IF-2